MKKILGLLFISLCFVLTAGCSRQRDPNTLLVGVISGPETDLMQTAKIVAQKKYGLDIKIVQFSDYTLPNLALQQGSIDANVYQTIPYLQSAVASHKYNLVYIGKTFIYPMALYSSKYKKLSQIPYGSDIAIPNDPSNEARALLLLQSADLIQLKSDNILSATPDNIISNPKHFEFKELDAANLPRSLSDVAAAAINTNYAQAAGLSPKKDGLLVENKDAPYANIIVIHNLNKNVKNGSFVAPPTKQLKELVESLHSREVVAKAQQLFRDGAIAAWDHAVMFK